LEFNIRDLVRNPETGVSPTFTPEGLSKPHLTDVWPEAQVENAARMIRNTYQEQGAGPNPKELTKELEKVLEAPRVDWPTGLCRRLWDYLAEINELRRLSPQHLARWYYLVGFCLRPGFGDPLDKFRVEQLWKILHAPPRNENLNPGRVVPKLFEGGADYWIMWRRVAGGLNAALQQSMFDRLRPSLVPSRGKVGIKPSANELAEMWRTAASLERLDVKQKELLGETLLKPLKKSPAATYGLWSLTRLGARMLFYGPLNAVVYFFFTGFGFGAGPSACGSKPI
jgi:hypothetical protein